MSAPIGPGDYVECIRSPRHHDAPGCKLTVGAIYQVEWVGEGYSPAGDAPGLRVVDDPLPAHCAWRADDFRPIYRPKSDFIESLKQPSPERESEPA